MTTTTNMSSGVPVQIQTASYAAEDNEQGVPSISPVPPSPGAHPEIEHLGWSEEKHFHKPDFTQFRYLTESDLLEYEDLINEDDTLPSATTATVPNIARVITYQEICKPTTHSSVAFREAKGAEYDDDLLSLCSFSEEDEPEPFSEHRGEIDFTESADDVEEDLLGLLNGEEEKLLKDEEEYKQSMILLGEYSSDLDFDGLGEVADSALEEEVSLEDDAPSSSDGLYECSATASSYSSVSVSGPFGHTQSTVAESESGDFALAGVQIPFQSETPSVLSSGHLSTPSVSSAPCVILEYDSSFYCLFSPFHDDPDADVLFETCANDAGGWSVERLGEELSGLFGIRSDVVVEFPTLQLSFSPSTPLRTTMKLDELVRMHDALHEGNGAPFKMLLLECRNAFDEQWAYLQKLVVETRKRKREFEVPSEEGARFQKAARAGGTYPRETLFLHRRAEESGIATY